MPRRTTKPSEKQAGSPASELRLQRVLSSAGFGSRRECEQLIVDGRVEVDGQIVTELGVRADPAKQKIQVDGTRVKIGRLQYYAVNKPPGVVSTCNDPAGRTRVIDLIDSDQRVYNVGRLDKSSEGLILVTNDGELANRLTHPRFGIEKTYLVTVAGRPSVEALKGLQRGVYLAEGFARVSNVRFRRRLKNSSELQIVLDEGRNREIRRLLAKIGHKVTRLKRIAIGPLRLAELPVGAHRRLERGEVAALKRAAASQSRQKGAKRKPPKAKVEQIGSPQKKISPRPKLKSAKKKSPSGRKARSSGPRKKATSRRR